MFVRSFSAIAVLFCAASSLAVVGVADAQASPPVATPSPVPTIAPTVPPTATPAPKVTRAQTRARLGRLDALAQRIVRNDDASASADVQAIGEEWPNLRSHLVAFGAARNDLIGTDTAVRLLRSATNVRRAANGVTAALAPIYPAVGDRVPANVHRLDYLNRAIMLDVAAMQWTRANGDAISAQSTWGGVRTVVVAKGAKTEAASYNRALDAVQDAIAAQNRARATNAVTQSASALAAVEKTLDRQVPPWQIFLQKIGM